MERKILSEVKTIKTDRSCVVKKTPIKVAQEDVDDLNLKIRQDLEDVERRRETGLEYAKDIVMK